MYYIDHVLTDEDRLALTGTGVAFEEVTIGSATVHRHGLAFAAEDWEAVIDCLGLIPKINHQGSPSIASVMNPATGDHATEGYASVRLVQLPTSANPVIYLSGYDGSSANQSVYATAYPELQLGMVVDTIFMHQPSAAIIRRGLLYVRPSSVPDSTTMEVHYLTGELPNKLIRVIGRTRDFTVVRNSNNRYIALFQGDANGGTLWLLFDEDVHSELLAYVLHSLARQLHPELGEPLSCAAYMASASRRRFIAAAQQRLQIEESNLPGQIADTGAEVETAQRALTSALRQLRTVNRRQAAITSGDRAAALAQVVDEMDRELEALLASPDFTKIDFTSTGVIAETRPIEVEYGGMVYSMGCFRIEASLDVITINSVDEHRSRCLIHPHIMDGQPCFGNQAFNFARLQSELRYGLLLPLIVVYLERGYQPHDSYARIESFGVPTRVLEETSV